MHLKLLLAGLIAATPVPALAQVTATYEMGKQQIRIETAANGDYRVDFQGAVLMRAGGTEYLAMPDKSGAMRVTKFRDMLALVEAQMKKGLAPPAPPEGAEGESPLAPSEEGEGEAAVAPQEEEEPVTITEGEALPEGEAEPEGEEVPAEEESPDVPFKMPTLNYKLTRGAEEQVAGHTGTAWAFGIEGGEAPPEGEESKLTKIFVMSKDPALAPLQAPFKLGIDFISGFVAPMFGPESNFTAKLAELMGHGVPLRIGEDMKLVKVETVAIDPERFELPGPVIQASDFMTLTSGGRGGGAMPPLP